ncbi:anthranilate phosphoribosyltransferase [Victivallis sp. Marseille-Q1083]|uniref:anthranilate phosphoribosyltransferase n=1 Tax=Victivallis sp. Marseille-Q1083 TaxID=2717288 RepID=UPI00158A80F5|nr:anthranilate phosphoribosyltransferase [Victivallis sp. Marseille-Q1083]
MLEQYLNRVVDGQSLTAAEAAAVIDGMMDGKLTPAQSGALLAALKIKGESCEEIVGGARAMRRHARFIDSGNLPVIDTCGTGGDHLNTFNISTTVSFVAAAAGVPVAKHGNRSASSLCGSADVLAELGFNLDADPLRMEECLLEHGIGFFFAPKVHPAMRQVAAVRRELKFRTLFNLLGPLCNPAGARGQLLGVFKPELTELFANALRELGSSRVMVVHGHDGLDEISCDVPTRISELRDGAVRTYDLYPELILGESYPLSSVKGGDAKVNAAILTAVLAGRGQGGPRAITLLNAAAAIVVGGRAETLQAGMQLAAEAVDSGAALEKLERLLEASRG